jgi:hypothetical protein
MLVDGQEYVYGTYGDRCKANEVAIFVRNQREVFTYVAEV